MSAEETSKVIHSNKKQKTESNLEHEQDQSIHTQKSDSISCKSPSSKKSFKITKIFSMIKETPEGSYHKQFASGSSGKSKENSIYSNYSQSVDLLNMAVIEEVAPELSEKSISVKKVETTKSLSLNSHLSGNNFS